jgi:hypothetical protein
MGISSRKAGTVVRCPKCAGEIIVPMPEGMQPPEPADQPAGPQAFEDPAFEQMLNEPVQAPDVPNESPTETAPVTPPVTSSATPPFAAAPPKRVGIFLPLGMLIVCLVIVVLLLIMMFVLGLIIGRHTVISETKSAAVRPAACGFASANMSLSAQRER